MERIKNSLKNEEYNYIWAFVLAVFTMFLAMSYLGIVPGGKYFSITGDLHFQYASFGQRLAEKIKAGSDLYYSFHIGMGINTSLIWAFYCMSPVDLFYLFVEDIELATVMIILTKAGLSSMFFQLFCRYNLNRNEKYTIGFSLCYGLCAFQFYVLQMSSLTDGMYFLPLVLILVKKLIEEKKLLLLPVVYASLFLANFYCGFIVGLASFGYLCVYVFLKKEHFEKKEVFHTFLRFFAAAVLGFLLASFLLVPAVYYVFSMGEGGIESFSLRLAHPLQVYMSMFMRQTYNFSTSWPYLYCGILPMLLAPFYFLNPHFSKKERGVISGITAFLLISFVVPPIYAFLHMFNQPNGYAGRYAYLVCFILLAASVREFPYLKEINWKKIIAGGGVTIGLLLICCFGERLLPIENKMEFGFLEIGINLGFLLIWLFLLYYLVKKQEKNAVLAFVLMVMIEVGINGYVVLNQTSYTEREKYEQVHSETRNLLQQVNDLDSSVYRINVKGELNKNNQSQYGYYDIGSFSSAYSFSLRETMSKLGLMSSGFCITELGRNETTDLLLGMKYALYPVPVDGENPYIERNEQVLNLGYMVSDEIRQVELNGENSFDNQELLVEAMTGTYYDIYENYLGEVAIEGENVGMEFMTAEKRPDLGDVLVITRVEPEAEFTYVIFKIEGDENRRAFAILSSGIDAYDYESHMVRTAYKNEDTFAHRSMLVAPHIVEMEQENGDYIVYIVYPANAEESCVVAEMFFAYYNEAVLTDIYANLSQNQWEIECMEDGYVRGRVSATEDKSVLFTTIPYEEGWSVKVDGQEAELLSLVEGAFLGVELSPGEHMVEFSFEAPWSKEGKLATAVGIVIWTALVLRNIIHNKKKSKEK